MFTLAIRLGLVALVVCAAHWSNSTLADTPFEYKFDSEKNHQHVRVFLKLRSFEPTRHSLRMREHHALIDGHAPVGIGPGSFSAATEFAGFEVSWNGQRVKVPPSIYSDLFNPSLVPKTNLRLEDSGSVWASLNADGTAVLVEIEGGDDAVSYKVWIIISRNGKCLRFVEDTTP